MRHTGLRAVSYRQTAGTGCAAMLGIGSRKRVTPSVTRTVTRFRRIGTAAHLCRLCSVFPSLVTQVTQVTQQILLSQNPLSSALWRMGKKVPVDNRGYRVTSTQHSSRYSRRAYLWSGGRTPPKPLPKRHTNPIGQEKTEMSTNPFAHRVRQPYAELTPDWIAPEYAVRTDATETVTSLVAGFAAWERRWDARTRNWHVASWRVDELAAELRRNRFDVRFGGGQ